MGVASLPHYLHGRSRLLVSVGIAVALLCVLYLLGYAVFASDLTGGPMPDTRLMGPFRWWSSTNIG